MKQLAKLTIVRYRPFVIGVTGSVGKTSTKLAISAALGESASIRALRGNLNNELGFPLAILGDYDGQDTGKTFFWVSVIAVGVWRIIWRQKYPQVLVLEYGADRPGDLDYLLSIARPNVAVVTAVGDIPVHVEFYSSPAEVAKEKSKLVKALKADGLAVLNFDDPAVMAMSELTDCKITTYGFEEGADLRIVSFENRSEFGRPLGISFKLQYQGSLVPVRIEGVLGRSQAYAAAAAAAVALRRNINLVKIVESLSSYRGERGRTQIVRGIMNSYVIDDTYNASPASVKSALEILKDMAAPRKVAVLGGMAELGQYSEEAHQRIGVLASRIVDLLITVGPKARGMATSAVQAGMSKNKVIVLDSSEAAAVKVRELVLPKDVILVKGSQSARMEKVVLKLMAEPDKASQLLVRQYGKWLKS